LAQLFCKGRFPSPFHFPLSIFSTFHKRLLGQVASGGDPLAEREAEREERKRPKLTLTFNDAVEAYIAAKLSEWKPGTAEQVINHLQRLAKPLHPLALAEIDRRKVAELLGSIQINSGPVARNDIGDVVIAKCSPNLGKLFLR